MSILACASHGLEARATSNSPVAISVSRLICPVMEVALAERDVHVHLTPHSAPESFLGTIAVAIDVLRASTTIVHALAAGCNAIRPCAELEDAKALADSMPAGKVLLAGERDARPISGFDLGNSPGDFTQKLCKGTTLVLTTTNGTRLLARVKDADRALVAAFVNYSAICEQLRGEKRPVHIVCAGNHGAPTLEDTLLAGAFIEYLSEEADIRVNDAARLAWDCFENHGRMLQAALEISDGGAGLKQLGYDDDIKAAAQVDKFAIVPELRKDPLRIEIAAVGVVGSRWKK